MYKFKLCWRPEWKLSNILKRNISSYTWMRKLEWDLKWYLTPCDVWSTIIIGRPSVTLIYIWMNPRLMNVTPITAMSIITSMALSILTSIHIVIHLVTLVTPVMVTIFLTNTKLGLKLLLKIYLFKSHSNYTAKPCITKSQMVRWKKKWEVNSFNDIHEKITFTRVVYKWNQSCDKNVCLASHKSVNEPPEKWEL